LKAGKAYISSFGTTGLLVASSVILLIVVGALIAFDAWPTGASAGRPENVALGPAERAAAVKAARAQTSTPGAPAIHSSAGTRGSGRATTRTARSKRGKAVTRDGGRPVSDNGHVVSGLPHPTTDSSGDGGHPLPPPTTSSAPGTSGLPLPTSSAGSAVSTGRETTSQVAGVVSGISPQAGALVTGVGDTVDHVVGDILPGATAQGAP
jgi:hypothetical protein